MRDWVIIVLLTLVAVTGLIWINYHFSVQNPGGNDFLARWMGTRKWLMEGVSPYDQSVSLATQEVIYGHPAELEKGEDVSHFIYPLTSMVFFAPFGLLEYLPARALWMTLLELSMMVLAIVSMRLVQWQPKPAWTVSLILFSLFWYHGIRTVIVGQFAAIEAVLITGALLLIMNKNDVEAGILLALATAKPQMSFLIIPFVLIWAYSRHRFSLIWSFAASLLGLFALSLVFIPTWPMQMMRQIMEYPDYTARIGSLTSILASAFPKLSTSLNIGLQIAFWVYLIVEWVVAWKKDSRWFLWTAMMTLVLTNFLTPRTATTNYVMLLPVLFLIFKILREQWGNVGNWLVGFMLALGLIGLWTLFLSTVQGNLEQPAMYVPLPVFSLFGLWWVRRWAIAPAPLPRDEELAEL